VLLLKEKKKKKEQRKRRKEKAPNGKRNFIKVYLIQWRCYRFKVCSVFIKNRKYALLVSKTVI